MDQLLDQMKQESFKTINLNHEKEAGDLYN